MVVRWLKWGGLFSSSLLMAGVFLLGTDLPSYITCSTNRVRRAVKESVPIDFELHRARDMLEQLIPEIHTKIRLIAHEEVEVAVASLVSVLEPVMVVVLGGMVGFIVLALFSPLVTLIQSVSGGI